MDKIPSLLFAWLVVLIVGVGAPAIAAPPAPEARTGVVINGKELTPTQYVSFARMYGVPPQPGRWWYDPASGQFGRVGEPVSGLVRPGHDFGPLAADASRGTTGIFLNGRQLPATEVTLYTLLLGPIVPGRYWLDPQGNVGRAGNPMPVANLVVAAQAANLAVGGRSPADAWLSGNEWSGRMSSGTVDTSGQGNSVYSVDGEVLTLPF
ncbi:MAG: hypothetical protein AAF211_25890 [Myxococcota bacterium]